VRARQRRCRAPAAPHACGRASGALGLVVHDEAVRLGPPASRTAAPEPRAPPPSPPPPHPTPPHSVTLRMRRSGCSSAASTRSARCAAPRTPPGAGRRGAGRRGAARRGAPCQSGALEPGGAGLPAPCMPFPRSGAWGAPPRLKRALARHYVGSHAQCAPPCPAVALAPLPLADPLHLPSTAFLCRPLPAPQWYSLQQEQERLLCKTGAKAATHQGARLQPRHHKPGRAQQKL
jgi:hypothetical protein